MPARVYATAQQVKDLAGVTLPASSAERTLRRASRAVDRILKGATYQVDPSGYPTDPNVRELLAEMVAEQCAWYDELGDETGVSALAGGSIGRVSLPSAGGGSASPEETILAPEAQALARESEYLEWRVRH